VAERARGRNELSRKRLDHLANLFEDFVPATELSPKVEGEGSRERHYSQSNIKKGTGEGSDGVQFDEIVYEGYAGDGVGIIVKCLTENRNRTAAEVRHCFNKANNNLGQTGSVSRSFQRKGLITFSKENTEEEALLEAAMEAGAADFEEQEESFVVSCEATDYNTVSDALEQAGFVAIDSELTLVPDLLFEMTDVEKVKSVMAFIEALEDLDDVQNVYTNMDVPDEIAEQLGDG
jgi:YebC/PmpR family DNA-binding regulatory protein